MTEALGVTVEDLPEGWQPTEVLVIAKCLLPEGSHDYPYGLVTLASRGLAAWDVSGMARSALIEADDQMRAGGSEH